MIETVKASNFFDKDVLPITVISIHGDASPQHDGDLTDIKHFHDFAELVIITEGYGVHWIDGIDYPVAAGDVFVLQGRTEHYFRERHNLSLSNIMYDTRQLQAYLKNLQGEGGYNAMFLLEPNYRKRHKFKSRLHISRKSLAYVGTVIGKMLLELKNRAPGFDTVLLCHLLELIVFFSREYSKSDIPLVQSLYRIGRVIGKLEKNYRHDWTLAEIARTAHMSKSGLMTTFREATGHTPIDYLIRIRLQKAAELLTGSSMTVSEIATECGFIDSNYFSRQFRKKYNLNPREFRKNAVI